MQVHSNRLHNMLMEDRGWIRDQCFGLYVHPLFQNSGENTVRRDVLMLVVKDIGGC